MTDELLPLRELDRRAGGPCHDCPRVLCGHEVLFSVALGLKDVPRCLGCLARGLARPAAEVRDQFWHYLRHRDCYARAWRIASEREGFDPERLPACLWPAGATAPATRAAHPPPEPEPADGLPPAAAWDAGDMGCGDLVLALRGKLLALPPGAVLQVTARDPAAPEDLPAWCRLTGHRLARGEHPVYHIQRKGG